MHPLFCTAGEVLEWAGDAAGTHIKEAIRTILHSWGIARQPLDLTNHQ